MKLFKNYCNNTKNIDWNIGGLFAHDKFIFDLLDCIKVIGEPNTIKCVFGSIPCMFQGGRIPPRDATIENARNIINAYNKRGVSCLLTFSNYYITKSMLDDKLSNSLLDILYNNNKDFKDNNNINNGIILSSDLLLDYVKNKYSNLYTISSQVKPSIEIGLGSRKDNASYYNNLLDRYDTVVVNPFLINSGSILNNLKAKDRIEFIVNHRCIANCPMAKEHYTMQMKLGQALLNKENAEKIKYYTDKLDTINQWCYAERDKNPLNGTSMSNSQIDMLVSMGFKHFKIEGRDNNGTTFIRDLGDYIFNSNVYTRLAQYIVGNAV